MRTWTIWGLDVGKQGVALGVAHVMNLILSEELSKRFSGDVCLW